MNNNSYRKYAEEYIKAGYSVIPGTKGRKYPAILGWSKYCNKLPSSTDITKWSEVHKDSNLILCLGNASNVIAVDFDGCGIPEIDEFVIEELKHLPPTIEKVGAKGFTKFYQHSGEKSQAFSFNGFHLIDLLSSGRCSLIPPSVHPDGMTYRWTGNELLSTSSLDLPFLPTDFLDNLIIKLGNHFLNENIKLDSSTSSGSSLRNDPCAGVGRNQYLKGVVAGYIFKNIPKAEVVQKAIEADTSNFTGNEYFKDGSEFRGSKDPFINASTFYESLFKSISKDLGKNITPLTIGGIDVRR